MQRGQWITVDSVVNDYLLESEQPISKYYKIWNLAYRGMDDMGLDSFYEIRTYKLPINANGTVTIPQNVLNWTKVGLFDINGQIYPLKQNDRLTNFDVLNPNRKSNNSDPVYGNLETFYSISSPCFYNYWDGFGFGYLYGSCWYGGTFKVDMIKNVIILDNWFNASYIVLEAMIAPVQGEEYYVPMVFREALISWIAWKDMIAVPVKTHMENTNISMRRAEYFNNRRLAIGRFKPFNIEQAAMV